MNITLVVGDPIFPVSVLYQNTKVVQITYEVMEQICRTRKDISYNQDELEGPLESNDEWKRLDDFMRASVRVATGTNLSDRFDVIYDQPSWQLCCVNSDGSKGTIFSSSAENECYVESESGDVKQRVAIINSTSGIGWDWR